MENKKLNKKSDSKESQIFSFIPNFYQLPPPPPPNPPPLNPPPPLPPAREGVDAILDFATDEKCDSPEVKAIALKAEPLLLPYHEG